MTRTPDVVCWNTESVNAVLHTEALSTHPAVFLATHSPIRHIRVEQQGAAQLGQEPDEERLLEVLSQPSLDHALCVVEGEPGSGKSHLIRWLSIRWRTLRPDDIVLLVPRADGSLEGTLRRLETSLGEIGVDTVELSRLSSLGEIATAGRSLLFKSALAVSFAPEFFRDPPQDTEWCRTNRLKELFGHEGLQEKWVAPDRILGILSGSDGSRDSAVAHFTREDIRSLLPLLKRLQQPAAVHVRLRRELEEEADSSDAELLPGSTTIRLVNALNARLNPAVQQFLGISPDDLREAFRKLRRTLRQRNRRLVLMLEDITNFQGIDNALIDVLITDARITTDESPLISVVGVTPQYLDEVIRGRGNYLQRFTHHLKLTARAQNGRFEYVTALSSPDEQLSFAAKYLNAVRVGAENLILAEGRPRNACAECPVRVECHRAFGAHEDIGFFPLTKRFIVGNFAKLEDPDARQTPRTPRGMIQALLTPALYQPKELKEGHFPGPQMRGRLLPHAGLVDPVTEGKIRAVTDDENSRARLRTFLSLWNVDLPRGINADSAGAAIFERFRLTRVDPVGPSGSPGGKIIDRAFDTEQVQEQEDSRSKEYSKRLQQLARWQEGARLEDDTEWKKLVTPLLKPFAGQVFSVPSYARQKLLTESTWGFSGPGKVPETHLAVPPELWVTKGLAALMAFRLEQGNEASMLAHANAFSSRLFGLVQSHVEKRWGSLLASGGTWDPIIGATQVLALRTIVQAAGTQQLNSLSLWKAIFANSDGPAVRHVRHQLWDELVDTVERQHAFRRDTLVRLLQLPQASSVTASEVDPLDAVKVLTALREISGDLRLSTVPTKKLEFPSHLSELQDIGEVLQRTAPALQKAPAVEWTRIVEQANAILGFLRGHSVPSHLKRLDKVITDVSRALPQTEPGRVGAWKTTYHHLSAAGFDSEAQHVVAAFQTALSRAADDDDDPAPRAASELLRMCLTTPVVEFSLIDRALRDAEETVRVFLEHVRALVAPDPDTTQHLGKIQKVGNSLKSACSGLEAHHGN